MKHHKSKSFNTKFGSFIFGYNFKSFGIGLRLDTWGVSADFLFFWFCWER